MPNYIPSMTSAYRRSLRIFVHHESVCKNIIHSLNNSICWFNTPKIVWTLLCVLREKENCSILIIWVSFQKRKKRKNLTKILFLILHCTQILEILKLIRGNHVLATHTLEIRKNIYFWPYQTIFHYVILHDAVILFSSWLGNLSKLVGLVTYVHSSFLFKNIQ